MKSKNILVSLVTLVVLVAVFAASASAFGSVSSVEVKGEEVLNSGSTIAVFSGETLPVRVTFTASDNATDARVKVWIAGSRELAVSSERFKAIAGSTYTRLVSVQVPTDLKPTEELTLVVSVESRNDGSVEQVEIPLAGQRESYNVEVLDANIPSKIAAGETLALDIVLKNRGIELSEDAFVKVSIPQLGIEERAYFGDLSATDQSHPDKEDAVERRVTIRIPSSAKAGIYTIELEAYDADSVTTASKKIAIVGASDSSMVVSSTMSKTFAVGEKANYKLTLVNSGNKVRVYDLSVESPDALSVSLDESIVVVPAGSSKTVALDVTAAKTGRYTFSVGISSDDNLVKTVEYSANVEGTSSNGVASGNTTVLLTVVLAIIFVVLLVVLIVLLTRKPDKQKEFGESYY